MTITVMIKQIIINLILGFTALLFVCLLWRYNLVLTIVLFVMLSLQLLVSRDKKEVILAVFCGISGAIAETIAIFFGAWFYSNPSKHLFIPIWLPLLWAIAAVFMRRVYTYIEYFSQNLK